MQGKNTIEKIKVTTEKVKVYYVGGYVFAFMKF